MYHQSLRNISSTMNLDSRGQPFRHPSIALSDLSLSNGSWGSISTASSTSETYTRTLDALSVTNADIEVKLHKIRTRLSSLTKDLLQLDHCISSLRHKSFPTWQADVLTKFIDEFYTIHLGGVPHSAGSRASSMSMNHAGARAKLTRDEVDRAWVAAAKRVDRRLLWTRYRFDERYFRALHTYENIVHFRSPDPFSAKDRDGDFGWWLESVKERCPELYSFWARLYLVAYGKFPCQVPWIPLSEEHLTDTLSLI